MIWSHLGNKRIRIFVKTPSASSVLGRTPVRIGVPATAPSSRDSLAASITADVTVQAQLRSALLRFFRSERGMALPTAMFATVASLGLAGAAVMASVDVQHGSKRDSGSKSAIAAADAGANVAMLRVNREREDLVSAPCLDGALPAADGWCPAVTGSVGNATYSYRVSPADQTDQICPEYDLCVAATGTAGGVSRRVLITFNQGASGPGGGGKEEEGKEGEGGEKGGGGGPEGLIGKGKITLSGNADIRVNVGTNGTVEGSGSHTVCGNIRHGIGQEVTPGVNQCDGYGVTEENVDLPPVTDFMPADIATNNANGRITKCTGGQPTNCQTAGYSGNWSSQPPFNPSTRVISLDGNKSLTLPEGDYWVCQLALSGSSELIMQAGAKVRLFFDTPEKCGTTTPMSLSGNVKIKATGYDATTANYEMPGFFFLGSPTTPSSINLSGNFGTINELVIYAPQSTVNISGDATFKGLFVGDTINVTGSGVLENDDGFTLPPWLNPWPEEEEEPPAEEEEKTPPAAFFTPQFYVECTGAEAATPDANC